MLVMNWITFIYSVANSAEVLETVQNYSMCSAIGDNPQSNVTCDMHEERLENLSNPKLTFASYVTIGFLPFFSIIYIVRVRSMLQYFTRPCRHDTNKEQETQYS